MGLLTSLEGGTRPQRADLTASVLACSILSKGKFNNTQEACALLLLDGHEVHRGAETGGAE